MKHTPGPWKTYFVINSVRVFIKDIKDRNLAITNCSGLDQNIANARLIASAPDLLRACIIVNNFLKNHPDISNQYEAMSITVKNAIAKAKGE